MQQSAVRPTIVETLHERAVDDPGRRAVTSVGGRDALTYGQLWQRVRSLAAGLRRSGVRAGDRVVLTADSEPSFASAYFAIHLAGAIAVPLDPSLPRERLIDVSRRAQPALIVGRD